MGSSWSCDWARDAADDPPCVVCGLGPRDRPATYFFLARGPGKYDGRWVCEACLEDKLRRASASGLPRGRRESVDMRPNRTGPEAS